MSVWPVVVSALSGLLLLWLVLIGVLWVTKPDQIRLRESVRLLSDVVRLLRRLAADPAVPRGVRVRVLLLLAYLASPVDLVPDFVPVLGYADDAIVVAAVLRSVARSAGPQLLESHWPGSPAGFSALRRLVRI